MALQLIPHALAILLALGAFSIVWMVGLACDVPIHSISIRALAGAAVFWTLGLFLGRIFVNCVCEAIGEHLAQGHDKENNAQRR